MHDGQFELLKGADQLRPARGHWKKCRRCQHQLLCRANGHTCARESSLFEDIPDDQALHRAAEQGQLERVRQLLQDGYLVDGLFDEQTPLMLAAGSAWLEVCRLLLECGADAKAAVDYVVSARLPETPALLQLFLDHGCEPQPLLYPVVGWSTPAAARVLLKAGVDVNRPDPDDGETALYKATGRSAAMICLLVKHGARLDQLNADGTHPLHFCCVWNLPERLKGLLQAGASPNQLEGDECPTSPLYDACNNGYHECARVLLEFGADTNLGLREFTPLMAASRHGSLALVKALLQHGADPNITDQYGKRALDYALAVSVPGILEHATLQAETWQKGAIHHTWGKNSVGEPTLKVRSGGVSSSWTSCHAAIADLLVGVTSAQSD